MGSWDGTDHSPEMTRIEYTLCAEVHQRGERPGEFKAIKAFSRVKVLPLLPEDPPLHVLPEGERNDTEKYHLVRTKSIRQNLFTAKTGHLKVSAKQPSPITLSVDTLRTSNSSIKLSLEFAPAFEEADPPEIHSMTAKLRSVTYFSLEHIDYQPDLRTPTLMQLIDPAVTMAPIAPLITTYDRLLPKAKPVSEQVTALSLLDATAANFALVNAVWLFERPDNSHGEDFNLVAHLYQSLRAALNAYPHWCGLLKSITTADGTVSDEARHLPPHAQRYGRVYVHYGTACDPGVEFIVAKSSTTLDALYPVSRTVDQPLWNRQTVPFNGFVPPTIIANALEPNEPNEAGICKPLIAIQITETACGGFILAAKMAHPLADISSLVGFVKTWAGISYSTLAEESTPALTHLFDPACLDAFAGGDINAEKPDEVLLQQVKSLPLHSPL
ncbi:hypothetical protein QQX98_009143 [Neonectria punicea]|uniref:Uncharacterized protein n=1 Tax=Neonectria punicea TaxID=979145 RepID=A0ABR1GT56_9HYPO